MPDRRESPDPRANAPGADCERSEHLRRVAGAGTALVQIDTHGPNVVHTSGRAREHPGTLDIAATADCGLGL